MNFENKKVWKLNISRNGNEIIGEDPMRDH